MMTRGDRVLILLISVLSLVALLILNIFIFSADVSEVIIEVNGQSYARYSLQDLRKPKEVRIDTEFGSNLLLLEQGKVTALESDCKDKLEMKAGAIDHAGQQLVCLPNRLVVRLKGDSLKIDGVTY